MKNSFCFLLLAVATMVGATTASAEALYFGGEQVRSLPSVGQEPSAGPLVRGQIEGALAGLDSAETFEGAGAEGDACCCDGIGTWWDNSLIFFAGDGWSNRVDNSQNNNFGFRTGINTGFALSDHSSIRGQIGASYAGYDFHGRDESSRPGAEMSAIEEQAFVTAGFYKPSYICEGDRTNWGAVYDVMFTDNFGEHADEIILSQLRGQWGYALDEYNEVGVWGALRLDNDFAPSFGDTVTPMDQVSAYWRHIWSRGGVTSIYLGGADDPGEIVFGLTGHIPLSDCVAGFGNVHYILPSTSGGDLHNNGYSDSFSEETWNITFGIVYYPGGKAVRDNVSSNPGLPLVPLADNGTFAAQAMND